MRLRLTPLAVLAACALLMSHVPRAAAQSVVLAHGSEPGQTIDLAMVHALPQGEQSLSMQTEHGTTQARFRGPLLWAVLQKAGLVSGDPRSHVRTTLMVTGKDGYTAALALGEIDPAFEGKAVLLADEQDGQALKDGRLRLVVPGDRRGGRSVRDVVRIELR